MKHKIVDDINVSLDIPTQDLEDLVDKITEAVVTVIVVSTAAHILKHLIKK